ELSRDDRCARLTVRRGDTDAAEERVHREIHLEIGVEGLEGDPPRPDIDRVIPGALGEGARFEHRRVMRGVGRSEPGTEHPDALPAVDLELKDLHDESVPGLRTVDEEGAGEGVLDLDAGEGVARL